MLLALALIGCGETPGGTEVIEVTEAPEAAPSGIRIATAPGSALHDRAPIVDTPLPTGEPIVRDCFGAGDRLERRRGGASRRTSSVRPSQAPQGGAPAPTASPRPPPPPPPPAVVGGAAPDDAAPGVGDLGGDGYRGGGKGGGGLLGAQEQKADAKPGLDRSTVAEGEPTRSPTTKPPAEAANTTEPNLPDGSLTRSSDAPRGPVASEPVYEWGAEVFLSNDDSMSLASAQRVLYAVSRGVALSPSEIRPHELLNYFSFDAVEPSAGRTFGVLGAAELEGDKLSLALSVRGANPPREPLDLTVLLDRSCSMSAEGRMAYTKRGLAQLSDNLQRGDRVDVVLFDSGICTPVENYVVGRDDPSLLSDVIAYLQPTSATDLSAGLNEAYRIQTSRSDADVHGRNRRVLLITDAELNSGNVDESLVSEVGRNLEEHGVKLSGIGVGREFNDRMLDMLTEKGQGAYVYLGSEAVVDRIFGPGFDSLVRTVAHDVKFSLELPDSLAMARFYGEEMSTDAAEVDPIHYHAGTTQLFLQDLALREGRVVESDPITMKIAFHDPTGEPVTEELRTTVGALLDADPHNVDKGRALMAFSDWVLAGAMGADPCGSALEAYRHRAIELSDDAEIGYVNGLIGGRCGVRLTTVVPARGGVTLKVKVDADIPIGGIELECGDRTHIESITASDTVAKFGAVQPGICTVRLQGTTPMAARIDVPETGGDLRCMVRGGRVVCS